MENIIPYLIVFYIGIILIEWIFTGNWDKNYYLSGYTLYKAQFKYDYNSFKKLNFNYLKRSMQTGIWGSISIHVHNSNNIFIKGNYYSFRSRQFFFTHGHILIDDKNGKITLYGRFNRFFLILVILFYIIVFSQYNLIESTIFLFGIILSLFIILFVERTRYAKMKKILSKFFIEE